MSPGILAQLWVEEETKRKELEKKLRETLQANQVWTWTCKIPDIMMWSMQCLQCFETLLMMSRRASNL